MKIEGILLRISIKIFKPIKQYTFRVIDKNLIKKRSLFPFSFVIDVFILSGWPDHSASSCGPSLVGWLGMRYLVAKR